MKVVSHCLEPHLCCLSLISVEMASWSSIWMSFPRASRMRLCHGSSTFLTDPSGEVPFLSSHSPSCPPPASMPASHKPIHISSFTEAHTRAATCSNSTLLFTHKFMTDLPLPSPGWLHQRSLFIQEHKKGDSTFPDNWGAQHRMHS